MEIVKLDEIADVYIGATIRRYVEEGNGNFEKVVVQRSIQRGIELNDFDELEVSNKINEKYFTKKGDVLMKTTSPNDAVCVKEEGLIVGERIVIIRLKDSSVCNFMAHQLNSQYIKRQLHKVMSSSAIPQVSVNDIKGLKVKLFDLETQIEYSELLNTINERIATYEKLIESDKDLQEGILDKLLGGK